MTLIFMILAALPCWAQDRSQSHSYLNASEKDIQWFCDAKFGVFIVWGPVSIKRTEISWSRAGERPGYQGGALGSINAEEYDSLYKQFNPIDFEAREWVGLFRDAGVRYVIFITKHHDGFCMFDTKLTDYQITNSPFKRDITAELAKACHEVGMPIGFYFSQVDWLHPAFLNENHERYYVPFFHEQVCELCRNYGKIGLLWFDGWPKDDTKLWGSNKLFGMIRQLQPAILINDRCGFPGDFETREGYIGCFETDRPWETIEILGSQWAWKPNDVTHNAQEVIQLLAKCVGRDGNLLMNVGPSDTGKIDSDKVNCLREIGCWLKKYGESIYGTRGGPYVVRPLGCCWAENEGIRECSNRGPYITENMVSTRKDNFIYLHVLSWDKDTLILPPIRQKIISHSVLTGGTAKISQTEHSLEVSVAGAHRDAIDTIIKLEFEELVETIPPIRPCP